MSPRIVDKRAKRQEILKAALRVIARIGISDFKMIEIAEEAGVGKGTLYEYFPSKTDLIVGCFGDMVEDWGEFLGRELAEVSDPVERVKMTISSTFEYFAGEQYRLDALFDFYAMGIPRRDGKPALIEMAPLYGEMIKQLGEFIQAGVESGQFRPVNADLAASIILAAIDGLFFQIALRVVSFEDTELQQQVGEIVLGGLLPRKPN
jgi:TetR/AcrR family fatty acid metabolism transcriptional regulator